ncbi:cyclin-dependent kinase 2-associated protein 1 isoform X1 [Grus americana]|uniref:cyclin-dependent kinase 2-associated protein 1 isoform X1 n=1 Tax=Grus americana TaxID=9117 RepID=UPI0024084BC7|nr:cyclin-dependent kinase 2-associated protein 1 isoform X1 [Grus americana]
MHLYSSNQESGNLILLQGIVTSWWMNEGPCVSDTLILRGAELAGSVHSPSTSMATSAQYRQLINDYGPPSLGYTQGMQGTSSSQVPQSKYAELLAIIEELGKEIRPTYAGSKSAMERLKRGIIHARGLVRECLAETERNARS